MLHACGESWQCHSRVLETAVNNINLLLLFRQLCRSFRVILGYPSITVFPSFFSILLLFTLLFRFLCCLVNLYHLSFFSLVSSSFLFIFWLLFLLPLRLLLFSVTLILSPSLSYFLHLLLVFLSFVFLFPCITFSFLPPSVLSTANTRVWRRSWLMTKHPLIQSCLC